jgi:predicted permease
MKWTDWYLRLRALAFRRRVDDELTNELGFHKEMMVRKNLARGLDADEARRQAGIAFGSTTSITEECRDQRRLGFIDTFSGDLRYAIRQLVLAPGFVVVAVLSLALGLGANTAIFAAVDALMLRKLPVREPDRLVSFQSWYTLGGGPGAWSPGMLSFDDFVDIRQGSSGFSDAAAIYRETRFLDGAQVRIAVVSTNYFSTLGVSVARGRTFVPDEDRGRGAHPVVVISDAYWRRQYGAAPDIVGRTLSLNGTTFTIVGVTPTGFSGDEIGTPRDVWFPMTMIAQVMSDRAALVQTPGLAQVAIVARLKPGVTVEQAEADVQAFFRKRPVRLEHHASGYSWQRRYYERPLEILMMAVGAVLLITCANIANLLLARSTARQKETAVRMALGASRLRILRQHLTESLLLTIVAGGVGIVFAVWATHTLESLVSVGPWAVNLDLHVDPRTLTFTSAIALLTGVLFGVAPAVRASRVSVLRAFGATATATPEARRYRRFGPRQILVVAQVAVSICLLIAAGLFVQTFRHLKFQDLGFSREDVLLVSSDRFVGVDTSAVAQIYQTAQERIEAIPGVISASPSSGSLMTGSGNALNPVTVEGYVRRPNEDATSGWNIVVPGYFKTLGMQLVAGRDFTNADVAGAPRVAIVNETVARQYFGRRDPIGRRFGVRRDIGNEIEIVGVVKDAKYSQVREANQRMIYFPYLQERERLREVNLAVRTNGPVPGLETRIRDILRDINPNFPILSIESMDRQLDRALMIERLTASLSSLFGVLGALLACVGLYGVIAYGVARRSSEIGVRLALGARRVDVLAMIVKEAIVLVLAGVLVGVPVGLAVARLVSSQLFGVSPWDPVTTIAVVMLMIAVSSVAAVIPARRATHVDPMTVLRYE